jgi:hypothetical protein
VGALGHLHALERAEAPPGATRTLAYARAWDAAARWLDAPEPARLEALHAALASTELELVSLGARHGRPAYALIERDEGPNLGWDTALLVPGAPGPAILVPRPVAEAPIAEAASVVCRRMQCRALVVAGADVQGTPWIPLGASFDVVRNALSKGPTLELRADPATGRDPVLHVGAELPSSIDLRLAWSTDVALDWSVPPIEPTGPLPPIGGLLRLHPRDLDALLQSDTPPIARTATPPPWVVQRERDPVVRTLSPVPPPSALEARYLELELVAPLVGVAAGRVAGSELERLAWRAARLGLELHDVEDCGDERPCLALVDPLGDEGLGWGALLVRRGPARAFGVEVPRPGRAFGTQQLGLELWEELDGRAIYIGPTSDELQDPLVVANIHSPLMPYHQALDRSLGDGTTRPLLVQVLGFGEERMLDTDLVIGVGRPALEERQQPASLRWALEHGPLAWAERPLLSDGSPLLHELSGQGSAPVEYSLELGAADVALLWFSPAVRERFVRRGGSDETRRLRALGLEYGVIDELDRLRPGPDERLEAAPPPAAETELDELLQLATAYRRSHDIHALRRLTAKAKARGVFDVSLGQGVATKLPLLLLEAHGDGWSLRSLALLDAAVDRRDTLSTTDLALRERIGLSLLQRDGTIVVRSEPATGGHHAP